MGRIVQSSDREWLQGMFGDEWAWLTGEAETGGAYSLLERIAHVGARSAPHQHRRIESLYVLDGEFEFTVGGRTVTGGPGTLVIAQENESHGWKLLGDQEGRMLLFFAPSTPQAFYGELAGILLSSTDAPDMAKVLETMNRHGIT